MGREQFKTPDEDVAAEFDRVCQLFQLVLGRPSDRVLFESLMGEASEMGMNWVQGLEYVIHNRPGSAPLDMPPKRQASSVWEGRQGTAEDLRQAS